MCVYSMVVDHYRPRLEQFIPTTWPVVPNPLTPLDEETFRKLAKDFQEAIDAARKVDTLTAQPDCEDPEKAKLIDRVAALEKELAALKKPRRKRRKEARR